MAVTTTCSWQFVQNLALPGSAAGVRVLVGQAFVPGGAAPTLVAADIELV